MFFWVYMALARLHSKILIEKFPLFLWVRMIKQQTSCFCYYHYINCSIIINSRFQIAHSSVLLGKKCIILFFQFFVSTDYLRLQVCCKAPFCKQRLANTLQLSNGPHAFLLGHLKSRINVYHTYLSHFIFLCAQCFTA